MRSALAFALALPCLFSCAERRAAICDPLVPDPKLGALLMPGADGPDGIGAEEREMLRLHNAYRASLGLPPLRLSDRLTHAARWMSRDMATKLYLEHTDSQGRGVGPRVSEFTSGRYERMAENIANGNATAAATFEQWRNSPAHEANLRSVEYSELGIARAGREGSECHWYWTAEFGG